MTNTNLRFNKKSTPKVLDTVTIASPCPVDWDTMKGEDAKRFCSTCRLHIYNISAMTERNAENFLRDNFSVGRQVCIKLYKRADGKLITKDCHSLRMQLRHTITLGHRAAAVVASFFVAAVATYADSSDRSESNTPSVPTDSVHAPPLLQNTAERKFKAAAIEFDNKDFEKALHRLKTLDLTKPIDLAERHYLKALCLQALGRFNESRHEYECASRHCRDFVLLKKVEIGKLQTEKKSTTIFATQITGPFGQLYDAKALSWHGVPVLGTHSIEAP